MSPGFLKLSAGDQTLANRLRVFRQGIPTEYTGVVMRTAVLRSVLTNSEIADFLRGETETKAFPKIRKVLGNKAGAIKSQSLGFGLGDITIFIGESDKGVFFMLVRLVHDPDRIPDRTCPTAADTLAARNGSGRKRGIEHPDMDGPVGVPAPVDRVRTRHYSRTPPRSGA